MSALSAAAQDEDGDIISALRARVADLEAQLYAVGAGGVGSPVVRQGHPEQHPDMVPEGWKLVPVEPTTKMIDAARSQSSFPAGVWRAMLAAAPQPPVVEQPQGGQEPVAWQSIEAMAAQRYKVVPSHDSMFYRHAVVAGDGTQQLYIGRETECENMTRKFAGAFLDGAYVASLYTHPQPPRQPLTDEEIFNAIRPLCNNDTNCHAIIGLSIDEYRAIEEAIWKKNS